MDTSEVYTRLARLLDSLPNGFPSAGDGSEIKLLQKLFTPQQAAVALLLTPELQNVPSLATTSGLDPGELRQHLKQMVRAGLIKSGRTPKGLGFGLLPFVVGFFENQVATMDRELAELVEAYFTRVFDRALKVEPQFHRVIPVGESVRSDIEIHPFENAAELVSAANSWGVLDCVCRKQKNLIGEGCHHPVDVCLALADTPGAFENNPVIRALTLPEALSVLERAAKAGLVHSVSNSREGIHYVCNCCTCSCGILRGVAATSMANVVARSAFVNTVEKTLCNACENCLTWCQFDALSMDGIVQVNEMRCVGCGVCIQACPSGALSLVRRPDEEVMAIPQTPQEWESRRLAARGLTG